MTQITLYSYSIITQIMMTRDLRLLLNPHLSLSPSQLAGRLQVARARNSALGGPPYVRWGIRF